MHGGGFDADGRPTDVPRIGFVTTRRRTRAQFDLDTSTSLEWAFSDTVPPWNRLPLPFLASLVELLHDEDVRCMRRACGDWFRCKFFADPCLWRKAHCGAHLGAGRSGKCLGLPKCC